MQILATEGETSGNRQISLGKGSKLDEYCWMGGWNRRVKLRRKEERGLCEGCHGETTKIKDHLRGNIETY